MEMNIQLHASAALPPRKRTPVTHWLGGWMVPRVGLDAVVREKNFQPRAGPEPPIVQLVAQLHGELSHAHLQVCMPYKC
jgi:hypothetical protein